MEAYQIIVDTSGADRLFRKFQPELHQYLVKFYHRAGFLTQREMRIQAPRGVSGIGLRETITYDVKEGHVIISPKKKYGKYDATVIELGRRPGKMPPWKQEWNPDFYKWSKSKGIEPFVLARSIARKGTRPTHFVRNTKEAVEPRINRWANEVVRDFTKHMNK